MTYGEYRRALPRLKVRKGYEGNETRALQFSAPVGSGVTIFSGQVIYLDANGNWALATPALANGSTPYLAWHDSTDTDVLSSGLLLGLSCAGMYVFETGYYVRSDGAFNKNDIVLRLSAGTPGSLTLAVAAAGGTTWDDATGDIIGVTCMGGEENVGTQTDINGAFIPAINTEALPMGGSAYMLPFTARWTPRRLVVP